MRRAAAARRQHQRPALSAVLPITRQAVAKHLAALDHAGLLERAAGARARGALPAARRRARAGERMARGRRSGLGSSTHAPEGRRRERLVAVRRASARLGALGAALVALALGGCGLEVGSPPSTVKLLITRDFGAQVLHSTGALHTPGGESVLELLQRNATVVTGPGGRRVQDIDGVAGSSGAADGGA